MITGDARVYQRHVCACVRAAGVDSELPVKKNQPTLRADIDLPFERNSQYSAGHCSAQRGSPQQRPSGHAVRIVESSNSRQPRRSRANSSGYSEDISLIR